MIRRTFGSWVGLFVKLGLISFTATVLSLLLFTLANFSDNAKTLIFYVKTNDAEMTRVELIRLHYFYDLSQRWKVQWLADKHLFRDAPFYELADSYLIRDWQKVQDDLKEKLDDPRAYPYGNAKFRQIKALYQGKKMPLDEALKITLSEVAADFEKTLRNCLDSGVAFNQCYDRVWNYDLATNKKDAEEALKGPQPQVKYILGPPKNEKDEKIPVPIPGKDKKSGDGQEGEEKPGSAGSPRKRP